MPACRPMSGGSCRVACQPAARSVTARDDVSVRDTPATARNNQRGSLSDGSQLTPYPGSLPAGGHPRCLLQRRRARHPARLTRLRPRQQYLQQLPRAALRERLVEVPALRRLHARRAAVAAPAFADQAVGVRDELLEMRERDPRDADAAGVTVVDED